MSIDPTRLKRSGQFPWFYSWAGVCPAAMDPTVRLVTDIRCKSTLKRVDYYSPNQETYEGVLWDNQLGRRASMQ